MLNSRVGKFLYDTSANFAATLLAAGVIFIVATMTGTIETRSRLLALLLLIFWVFNVATVLVTWRQQWRIFKTDPTAISAVLSLGAMGLLAVGVVVGLQGTIASLTGDYAPDDAGVYALLGVTVFLAVSIVLARRTEQQAQLRRAEYSQTTDASSSEAGLRF